MSFHTRSHVQWHQTGVISWDWSSIHWTKIWILFWGGWIIPEKEKCWLAEIQTDLWTIFERNGPFVYIEEVLELWAKLIKNGRKSKSVAFVFCDGNESILKAFNFLTVIHWGSHWFFSLMAAFKTPTTLLNDILLLSLLDLDFLWRHSWRNTRPSP